jgi:putative DNA primase/helicase
MSKPIEVTENNPCLHCDKPDWCYRLEPLSVCNRLAPPTDGWYRTRKTDKNGRYYYAPIQEKPTKKTRPAQKRIWEYPDRNGNPLVRVIRVDDGNGGKPKRWQEKWDGEKWVKGIRGVKRENIAIYRYQEIREAICAGKTIFVVEGEPCADALWNLGIPATTNIGGCQKWKPSDTQDLISTINHQLSTVVLCPDRDLPGIKHMEMISEELTTANIEVKIQWLYAFPNSPLWQKIPNSGGLDVADWIADYQVSAQDIINNLESPRNLNLESQQNLTSYRQQQSSSLNSTDELSEIETNYAQKCVADLYSDQPWVAINNQLYFWTGNYYHKAGNGEERKRISDWCNSYPVASKTQSGLKWKYAYATATHVDNIWRWLLNYFSYPAEKVNPPGWNCLNGVVKINWDKNQVSWELVPHNPKVIYTYISEVNYDPLADSRDCDRMLSCLEPAQQQLFLQTIASALDLPAIRKYRGREVRALLCQGHGNNGKDTLREAVRMLFGHTLTNATVSDFAGYDGGRKFSLAKLEGASINWSSENSSFNNLDQLQSLKAAITGEPLDIERKGVDEHEVMLNSVFLFNINEAPNLKAAMEAIQSRWAVLSFNKTYKKNADPNKGEIEADSRFRYDPNFLKDKVCPALLNKLLNALSTVITEGIDYSCTEEAIKNIQEETNHLWGFAREIGLDYQSGGRVYINDLWELLYKWYINNGTLEIISENGKEKKVWHDQVKRRDKNVKAPNQIYQRFSELFPQIKKLKNNDLSEGIERKGQSYLSGIAINGEPRERQWRGNGEAITLVQSHGEPREPINSPLAEILAKTQNLSREQKKQLASVLLSDEGFAHFVWAEYSSAQITKNLTEVEKNDLIGSPLDIEQDTASPTGSPTGSPQNYIGSPLDGERDTASPPLEHIGSPLDGERDTGFSTASAKDLVNDSLADLDENDKNSEHLEENQSPTWVRYRGETLIVASCDHGLLSLRQSGFLKIVHRNVPISQCEEIFYD